MKFSLELRDEHLETENNYVSRYSDFPLKLKSLRPNIKIWLMDNTQGSYHVTLSQQMRGGDFILFDNEQDAILFRLRWG